MNVTKIPVNRRRPPCLRRIARKRKREARSPVVELPRAIRFGNRGRRLPNPRRFHEGSRDAGFHAMFTMPAATVRDSTALSGRYRRVSNKKRRNGRLSAPSSSSRHARSRHSPRDEADVERRNVDRRPLENALPHAQGAAPQPTRLAAVGKASIH
jgi:hypothetical protein